MTGRLRGVGADNRRGDNVNVDGGAICWTIFSVGELLLAAVCCFCIDEM